MQKPIIGILLDYDTRTIANGGYANFPWYALRTHYSDAIRDFGGIPIFIPYEYALISEYLKICHGFICPGGDYEMTDNRYKPPKERSKDEAETVRLDFEVELILDIIEADIPLLGICAGFQALNLALGGTLMNIQKEAK